MENKKIGAMENGAITTSTGEVVRDISEQEYELLENSLDEYMEVPLQLSLEGVYADGEPTITYDKKEFSNGVKRASELAGYYTALRMAGASEQFILQILSNKDEINALKMQCEAQITIAEKQEDQINKHLV